MTPLQNLYYAIGQLAYAVATADGEIQKEERVKLHNIVTEELKKHNAGYEISEIIFQVMDKEKASFDDAYERAMKDVRLNSHYLSPKLKSAFLDVIGKVAASFPPVTGKESQLIERFRRDIEPLKGDPVYYDSK